VLAGVEALDRPKSLGEWRGSQRLGGKQVRRKAAKCIAGGQRDKCLFFSITLLNFIIKGLARMRSRKQQSDKKTGTDIPGTPYAHRADKSQKN